MYKPRPIPTDKVELPRELADLAEVLARNTHELWSQARLAEGWKPGPRRDDDAKLHPNLVDYAELAEIDKDYDRRTALGALKLVLALGGRIIPPPAKGGPAPAGGVEPRAAEAQRLLAAGEALAAYDLLTEGLAAAPAEPRLRQLMALALSRTGALERARDILLALHDEGHQDEETLGMLGGVYKTLAGRAQGKEAASLRGKAFRLYDEAFRRNGKYYAGINAATLALLSGRKAEAERLVRKVRELCGESDDYWEQATLGEAALVLGALEEAERRYRRAAALGKRRWADLASTRRQAKLLLAHLGNDPALADRWLGAATVELCTGGRTDGAAGAIVFAAAIDLRTVESLERAAERGSELHVVLPLAAERWLKFFGKKHGPFGVRRLRALLGRAARVTVADEHSGRPSPAVLDFARRTAEGLALLKAEALEVPLTRVGPAEARKRAAPKGAQRVMALLFADAVGYSKLEDEQIPRFAARFLKTAADVARLPGRKPALSNTWGDALYLVFPDTETAGRYALELRDRVEAQDWKRLGLPQGLTFRIALHAGPVYWSRDPVTRRPNFIGSHVSRAARIEPVTPPGQVYSSQPFAALAASQSARAFACEYVGVLPLAKKYGAFPLYHVRRRHEAAK